MLLLSRLACCLFAFAVWQRGLAAPARDLQLEIQATCSVTGDCSEKLQAALDTCTASSSEACTIRLVPPGATFVLEQEAALGGRCTGVSEASIALDGAGARLELRRGDIGFLNIGDCVGGISLRNFTLTSARPPFTYGIVVDANQSNQSNPKLVVVEVNSSTYPMTNWTGTVAAMHEVDPNTLDPKVDGLDWINTLGPASELTLRELGTSSSVMRLAFEDRAFYLQPGTGLVMRHVLEFSRPALDSIVLRGCSDVSVADVTIHTSPGMGLLAFDCTGVRLTRLNNVPAQQDTPLAGNADAIHLASCRGEVTIRNCTNLRQGDDGINVHSQYAVALSSSSSSPQHRIEIGPHANADKTSWNTLFGRPVFRRGDTVMIRRAAIVVAHAVVTAVDGSPTSQLCLTLQQQPTTIAILPGDIIESLSSIPSSVRVEGCSFASSRASGIIVQSNNALLAANRFDQISSAGISVGGYYQPFSESPFGSNVTIDRNHVRRCGLGHYTVGGGRWGQGAGIRIEGLYRSAPNATGLHTNVSITSNTIAGVAMATSPAPAIAATGVSGLTIRNNTFFLSQQARPGMKANAAQIDPSCRAIVNDDNRCCTDASDCSPCPRHRQQRRHRQGASNKLNNMSVVDDGGSTLSFGAIRWDAWNGRSGDIISSTVSQVMAPAKYHWRLPWYVNDTVDHGGRVTSDADRQAIMDAELQQAHGAGLRFWAYDTYCVWPTDQHIPQCAGYWGKDGSYGPTSVSYKPVDPAYALKLHRASRLKHLMNFTLLLLGASPATPTMRKRYLPYFLDPGYHRVYDGSAAAEGGKKADEGRPLVFLFQASDAEADMNGGWSRWAEDWQAFRNESIEQGTGNPYFVAMNLDLPRATALRKNLGFDAVSAYALPGGTVAGVPFAEQAAKAHAFWDGAAQSQQPVVPPVPTGWDPRPRADHPPPWVNENAQHYVEPTSAELTQLVADAAGFIRNHSAGGGGGAAAAGGLPVAQAKAAIMYAWNENTEGGWLIKTKGTGTERLDAVAKALLGPSE